MSEPKPRADREVSALYDDLRNKFGGADPKANGYVSHGYFEREQAILFRLLNPKAGIVLDVGCGSGLMCRPLVGKRELVLGVDFNPAACLDAKSNELVALRGDAFSLPLSESSVDEIINCQFFNQQSAAAVAKFIEESARVLTPGGRLIMIWRNGRAYVHRAAEFLAKMLAATNRRPTFPYVNHSMKEIEAIASRCGLAVDYQAVSFPPLDWVSENYQGVFASCLGASNICVLRK